MNDCKRERERENSDSFDISLSWLNVMHGLFIWRRQSIESNRFDIFPISRFEALSSLLSSIDSTNNRSCSKGDFSPPLFVVHTISWIETMRLVIACYLRFDESSSLRRHSLIVFGTADSCREPISNSIRGSKFDHRLDWGSKRVSVGGSSTSRKSPNGTAR